MSSSSPDWIKIVLGGSGALTIFGSITTFLIKQTKEQKDAHIKQLEGRIGELQEDHTNEIKEWERRLEEAKEREREAHNSLIESLRRIDGDSLSSEDKARFKRVMGKLEQLKGLQETLDDYKQAAKWIKFRKSIWVKEAASSAVRKFLIPKEKTQQFHQDVECYLDWVYECLHQYGHTRNNPLNRFVDVPAIQSSFPYDYAIRCIKRKKDWGELTAQQSTHLDEFLDRLLERISEEIDNQ